MAFWSAPRISSTNSSLSKVLPLFLLSFVAASVGLCLYLTYIIVLQISSRASDNLRKKNLLFTKNGVKVGVKALKNEGYVDVTQNYLVKTWNLGIKPEDKARLRIDFGRITEAADLKRRRSLSKLSKLDFPKF